MNIQPRPCSILRLFILIFSMVLHSNTIALEVEPALHAMNGVSLFLRNDGVLFQLGGQSFTPVPLPETAVPPIQPRAVILTDVVSLLHPKSQDDHYEGDPEHGMVLAIVSTPEINRALFIWDPQWEQPTFVKGLSDVKEVFRGPNNFSYFAVTQTGTVFSFDSTTHVVKQLDGLSNVKLITADSSRYVAITKSGKIFYGHWESNNNQYGPALQIVTSARVTDLRYQNNINYVLAGGKIYSWTWVLDKATSTYQPTPIIPITDKNGNELSQVRELHLGQLAFVRGSNDIGSKVYWWGWNKDYNIPTVALPITNLPDDITEMIGNNTALSLAGAGYSWEWSERSQAPSRASLIGRFSRAIGKLLNDEFVVLTDGRVHPLFPPFVTVEGLFNPKEIRGKYALTTNKNLYGIEERFDILTHFSTPEEEWILDNLETGDILSKEFRGMEGWYVFLKETVFSEKEKKLILKKGILEKLIARKILSKVKSIETNPPDYINTNSPYSGPLHPPYFHHYLALQEDGTLCGGGNNSNGQLGLSAPDTIYEYDPLCGIEDLIVEPGIIAYPLRIKNIGTGNGIVTADTGFIYCGTSCQADYPQGQTITLRVHPALGSDFAGWGWGDCTGGTVTITKAVNCTVIFNVAPNRRLTVKKIGHGTVTATPPSIEGSDLNCGEFTCTGYYLNLTEVTLMAQPAVDSSKWAEIDCTHGQHNPWPPLVVNSLKLSPLREDIECTVTFQPLAKHMLTISINRENGGDGKVVSEPAGIHCDPDCIGYFFRETNIMLMSGVTLTAIPSPGSRVKGYYGPDYDPKDPHYDPKYPHRPLEDYYDPKVGSYVEPLFELEPYYAPIYTTLSQDESYQFTFVSTPATPPDIKVDPPSHKFELRGEMERLAQDFSIANKGEADLSIFSIAVKGASDFRTTEDNCSGTHQALDGNCQISISYEPHIPNTQTATLLISSNDPDKPLVTIPFCAGVSGSNPALQGTEASPTLLDFGTELVGRSLTLSQWVKTWATGCGALIDKDKFTLGGTHAAEFSVIDKECYYAAWDDKTDKPDKTTYSTCLVKVKFTPTAPEGSKEAHLSYMLNEVLLVTPLIPLKAMVVNTPQYQLEASKSSLDFGEVALYRSASQKLEFKNAGNVNLSIPIELNAKDFSIMGGTCLAQTALFPGESCDLSVQFNPQGAVGEKQASLVIAPETPYTNTITLMGQSVEATECTEANITIESSGLESHWDLDTAWKRLQNPTEPNHPTPNDVVRIKNGHILLGPLSATTVVKVLCIEEEAMLQSLDNQGTSLAIQATHFLDNRGTILGQNGADETAPCLAEAVGTGLCAKFGANLILRVDGPLINEGTIKAGKGGSASQYAAMGGDVIVLGRNVLNKNNIQAGHGGDILGTFDGESGRGGQAQVWGNLGGEGYLRSETGTQISAGNAGNCHPEATLPQVSNAGGNLWLASFPDVYLGEGTFLAGKIGSNCKKHRGEGGVKIEPPMISLTGAGTRIEGGDISIYGGPGWTLDLSNLGAITSSGDITLAVGKEGVIDLRGNTGKRFQAVGKDVGRVNIFSDKILLDDDKKLSDLIEANQILVGPSKTLRAVTLMGANRIVGGPNTTTSLTLILANGSPERDTFSLTLTDVGKWTSSQLSPTIEVAGLEMAHLKLDVLFPATIGMTDTITVTATSQSDSSVTTTIHVQGEVVDPTLLLASVNLTPAMDAPIPDQTNPVITAISNVENVEPTIPSEGVNSTPSVDAPLPKADPVPTVDVVEPIILPVEEVNLVPPISLFPNPVPTIMLEPAPINIPRCPLTGVIDIICSNRGQTFRDGILTDSASIAGGILAGTVSNQGLVSNVTIQAEATLTGGRLTGYILNEGTLANFEFVGAWITGGTLAGEITNNSRVGGTFQDIHLAPFTHLQGGKLQGQIVGDIQAPARLENVIIYQGSFLSGVILGEGVKLPADVIFGEGVQVDH